MGGRICRNRTGVQIETSPWELIPLIISAGLAELKGNSEGESETVSPSLFCSQVRRGRTLEWFEGGAHGRGEDPTTSTEIHGGSR